MKTTLDQDVWRGVMKCCPELLDEYVAKLDWVIEGGDDQFKERKQAVLDWFPGWQGRVVQCLNGQKSSPAPDNRDLPSADTDLGDAVKT